MMLRNLYNSSEDIRLTCTRRSALAGSRLAAAIFLTAALGLHTAAVLCISFGIPLIPDNLPFAKEFPYLGALLAGLLLVLNFDLYLCGFKKLFRLKPDTDTLISVSTLAGFAYSLYILMTNPASALSLSFFPVVGFTLALTDFGYYADARAALELLQAQKRVRKNDEEEQEKAEEADEPENKSSVHDDIEIHDSDNSGHAQKHTHTPEEEDQLPPSAVAAAAATATGTAAVASMVLAAAGAGALYFLGSPLSDILAVAAGILIIACPAAIGLCRSLPRWISASTILSGGILIQSPDALRGASEINTLAIGRSLLLEREELKITDVVAEGLTDATFFSLAATAEADSFHPIAAAINDRAIRLHSRMLRASARTETPGCGVEALTGGASLRVGHRSWIQQQGVQISAELLTKADQLESKGKTVVFVSSNQFAKGLIAFSNEPKPKVRAFIKKLLEVGVEPVLITTDSQRSAKAIAQTLGISEFRASCHRNDRAKEIQILQAQGKTVALLDTLESAKDTAAAQADYVIAPQGTSEEAAKAAHIMLSSECLTPLAPLFTLSRRVEKLTRQNYIWCAVGTILALPVASGILYSFNGPLLSPPIALIASLPGFFASLINAIRLAYD